MGSAQVLMAADAAPADEIEIERRLGLLERLWQNGRIEEMARRLDSVKADDAKADSNLLAMKAISLFGKVL